MKAFKFILILLTFYSVLSCDNEDKIDYSNQLVGEWMRSDFSDNFEFKLIFQEDNTGLRIYKEGTMDTKIVSSLVQFNWSLDKDTLTFDEYEKTIKTKYAINSEGALILENYSELPFIRMQTD